MFATTSSSITLSLTGIGWIAIPLSTATVGGLSIGNKVTYQVIINKYEIRKIQKKNMKKMNKLIKILINYTENLYEVL